MGSSFLLFFILPCVSVTLLTLCFLDALLDLSKYTPEPKDGAVVAWPINHTRPSIREKRREIEITIKAQVLKEKEGGAEAAKENKDEL